MYGMIKTANLSFAWLMLVLLSTTLLMPEVHANETRKKIRSARLPKTSVELLRKYAVDSNWQVRKAVASNRNAPDAILHQLAQDMNQQVKISVATNLSTSERTFMLLANDPDITIRSVVARFEYVPASVLDKLAGDPQPDIRLEVARAFNTSEQSLRRLMKDDYVEVSNAARQALEIMLQKEQAQE